MDKNLVIQYTIVAAIIIAALVYLVIKFIKKSRQTRGRKCYGCSLSEKCKEAPKDTENCC